MRIKEITKKDGTKVYRASVYLGVDSLTGKQVRTTATARTRKQCEIKANQAINKFNKNGRTVARERVVFENFEALATEWLENYKLTVKANTIKVAQNFFNVYIIPAFGPFKIEKITTVLIQTQVNQWARNANTAHIVNGKREKGNSKDFKLILNYVQRILDYAVQLGSLSSNPAKQVIIPKLKSRTTTKIKCFDDQELKTFLNYLDNLEATKENQRNIVLYRFLLATGLRIGEALSLSWSDIDFQEQAVRVSKTLTQAGTIQDSPKSKSSNRIVYIDNDTISLLKKWRKAQSDGTILLSDTLAFCIHNRSYTYAAEKKKLDKHFQKAHVPNIGFHGFRHTHASLLMNNDVNPKEIQHRLGHSDYGITMNTYSHLAKYKEKNTADRFKDILKAL